MSIQDSGRRSPTYTGTGQVREFAFGFKVFAEDQVSVYRKVSDDAEVELVPESDYDVSLESTGGTVTMRTAPAKGVKLVIISNIPYTQLLGLQNFGSFSPEDMNGAWDKNTGLIQQVLDIALRSVQLPQISNETPAEFVKSIFEARDRAETAATNSASSASSASSSASSASASKSAAEKAKTAAETAKTGAESAKTAAEKAKTSAESAKTAAAASASAAKTSETNAATQAAEAKKQADLAAEAAKTAAFSYRYYPDTITANGNLTVSRIQPSSNVKAGDKVLDRVGKFYEIKAVSGSTASVGAALTSLMGPQGPKGDQGERGPKGDQGPQGAKGDLGGSLVLKGEYDSEDDLIQAHPTGTPGDAYLIQGDVWYWSPELSSWANAGPFRGPAGTTEWDGITGKPQTFPPSSHKHTSGDLTLGPEVVQYKTLSSIKSVAGTFVFDSNSGVSSEDLPAEADRSDWVGVQFGMKNGNDKTQIIFNNNLCLVRYSDANLGDETWDRSSWKRYDMSDIAQDSAVVHKAGAETISGAKTLTGGMAVVDTMIVRDLSAVKGTNPSSACFMGIWFADKNAVPGAATINGNVLGAVEAAVRANGTSDIKMYASRNEAGTDDRAQIMVGWRFNTAGELVPTSFLTNTVKMLARATGRTYEVFRLEKDGGNADNFVISGANQTTFLCSGEIGYDDPESAAVRAALRKSAEDVVIASDNRVVIASNCNSRDISQVKIAYLDASGYFHLPVDPPTTADNDVVPTTRWVRSYAVPSGTVFAFSGSTVPTGYLLCNGALVSRTKYSALFETIGTKVGEGDGETTFKLPDLRAQAPDASVPSMQVQYIIKA